MVRTRSEFLQDQKNRELMALLHAGCYAQFSAVLQGMRDLGWPVRVFETWRSPERQEQLRRAGHSQVSWGPHCAVTSAGNPDACAADMVHTYKLWGGPADPDMLFFKLDLLALSLHAQLRTGALFGMKEPWRADLKRFAEGPYLQPLLMYLQAPASRLQRVAVPGWMQSRMGWDPLHVEVQTAYKDLRAGVRPKPSQELLAKLTQTMRPVAEGAP